MAITCYKSLLTEQIVITKKKNQGSLSQEEGWNGYCVGTQPRLPQIASKFHSVLDIPQIAL